MKFIIAGGRDFNNYALLKKSCDELILDRVTEVVCGGARGADSLGERWANENNIPVAKFPADWDKFGKSAGYRRNVEMSKNSDGTIVFWDGESKGTVHMINISAAIQNRELHVIRYGENGNEVTIKLDEENKASKMW